MSELISEETDGFVRLIGLNRPEKRNAMNVAAIEALSAAFTRANDDDGVRVMLLFAHGPMFTAGLDLMDVLPRLSEAETLFHQAGIDPWATHGPARKKPLVVAVHGRCLTLGVELALAADVTIATDDATFEQIEIDRGIFPFGGGTARWIRTMGWGNAMRYLLTGDALSSTEAHRLGLVQQVVARDALMETAKALAHRIAQKAPLAIQATLESARTAVLDGEAAAARALFPLLVKVAATEDAQEALAAYLEKRPPNFHGR